MLVDDLVRKLVSCSVVEVAGDDHEPLFTAEFRAHIKKYAGLNRDEITIIQGWRQMLAGFHISLALLSDEELLTLTTLLVFQTKMMQAPFAN